MKKVYFYATCLGSAAMQEMVVNAIKLLRKEGVEVIFKKIKPVADSLRLILGILRKARRLRFIISSNLKRVIPLLCQVVLVQE